MISSRSPVRAQVVALLATSLLAIPYVAAESTERGLAARAPTPDRPRRFSTFVAENDLACCPAGSTEKYSGSCCATGLTVSQLPSYIMDCGFSADDFFVVCYKQ